MDILYILVPLAVAMAGVAVTGFFWAVRDGQFDDTNTPALRILFEEDPLTRTSVRPDLKRTPERDRPDEHDQPAAGRGEQEASAT